MRNYTVGSLIIVLVMNWCLPAWSATLTDNFNRANTEPMTGWAEPNGDWDIISSSFAREVSAGLASEARYQTDLDSENHYAQCEVTFTITGYTPPQQAGPTARHSTSARTYYWAYADNNSSGSTDKLRLYEVVAGTATQLGSEVNYTHSAPDTIKIQVDSAHVVKLLLDGVEKISVDDAGSPITGNKRCGIRGQHYWASSQRPELDNWEAGDLAASTKPVRLEQVLIEKVLIGLIVMLTVVW